MPAVSKAQQRFMGMVHGVQKGTIKPSDVSPEVRKVAKTMKKKDAKDFASTKHKGLPNKKTEVVKPDVVENKPVKKMTKEEFKKLIDKLVEQKLNKILKEGTWEKDPKANQYTDRDESRVFDIIEKSKGDKAKKLQLSMIMAKAITNIQKAIQRAKKSIEFGEKEMAKIFWKRAIDLGYLPKA